jgi:hypothetical protein
MGNGNFTSSLHFVPLDHVALSLRFASVGVFNSDYPENPLQEFSQIGYANFA